MENALAYFALQDKRKKVLQRWQPGCTVEMRKCGIIVLNKWIGLPMKNSLAYVAPQDKKKLWLWQPGCLVEI